MNGSDPESSRRNQILIVNPEGTGDYSETVADMARKAGFEPVLFDRAESAYGHLATAAAVVTSLVEPTKEIYRKSNSPLNLSRKASELGIPLAIVAGHDMDWYPGANQRDMVTPNEKHIMRKAFSTWFRVFDMPYLPQEERQQELQPNQEDSTQWETD